MTHVDAASTTDTAHRLTVGVIVTCYNYAQYVGQSIDSVLAQTRHADEIIVVDDGSTDGSRAVIETYGAKVRLITQTNAGQVAARNTGFAASRADIILFLDADDLLQPETLAAIEDAWNVNACKLQFELAVIDADGRPLGRRCCNFPRGYDARRIRREFERTGTYRWPVTSGNAYARSFLAPLMPMNPPHSQDGLLNTIAPLYGSVVNLTMPLGLYRLHGRNQSRHGSARASHPDFPKRIAIRHAEFEVLRSHAAARRVTLPPGNPLDRELVFVNYRLMARKLGQSYVGAAAERPIQLWRCAFRLAWSGDTGLKQSLAHSAWFMILLACPKAFAQSLIELRFDRANVFATWRRRARSLLGAARNQQTCATDEKLSQRAAP